MRTVAVELPAGGRIETVSEDELIRLLHLDQPTGRRRSYLHRSLDRAWEHANVMRRCHQLPPLRRIRLPRGRYCYSGETVRELLAALGV